MRCIMCGKNEAGGGTLFCSISCEEEYVTGVPPCRNTGDDLMAAIKKLKETITAPRSQVVLMKGLGPFDLIAVPEEYSTRFEKEIRLMLEFLVNSNGLELTVREDIKPMRTEELRQSYCTKLQDVPVFNVRKPEEK